jgi:hypothetical protein
MPPESQLILSIKKGGKAVPYGGSDVDRPDGARNYGFKNLKGKPEEVASIPEAQGNASLTNALLALAASDSPFFTVGCEKSCNQDSSGHWMKGFLEFSFNYRELVADAQFYFKLFYDFNSWYRQQKQEATIQYHFELEGAHFWEVSAEGFNVTVWITTTMLATEEEAQKVWAWGLDRLIEFLNQYPSISDYTKMY